MSVVTVGNFDGVHKGHRLLINTAVSEAEKLGCGTVVLTFEKHPKSYFSGKEMKVICTNASKVSMLKSLGVSKTEFLDFGKFSSMSGDCFLKYLKDRYSLSVFVAGEDFRFGKNAAYGVDFLKERSEDYGFAVKIIPFEKENKISSSDIRVLIENGNVEKAGDYLGYRYFISSEISSGKSLGRTLGFPTVNIFPDENLVLPKFGVYATDIILGNERYSAVSNVGVRPTVESDGRPNVETYILNRDISVSEKSAEIVFKKFIRSEKKFSSVDDLAAQIAKDCIAAEEIV